MADLRDDSPIEISITNLNTCCRLCLSSNNTDCSYDIANSSLASQVDVSTIQAIRMVINIEISISETLPSTICRLCYTRLDDAYCFIRDTVHNNELVQNYYNSESVDDESEVALSYVDKEEEHLEIVSDTSEFEPTECQIVREEASHHGSTDKLKSQDNEDDQPKGLTAVDLVLQHVVTTTKIPRPKRSRSESLHCCTQCDKKFHHRSNLLDHMRFHAQLKLYECEFCGKRFVQAGNLKTHVRIHTEEKPFHCSVCNKAFSQSSAMRTHERTHGNIRPYQCEICEKSFTSSSDRSKHKLTHETHKRYQCVICTERFFTQKVHLRNHLARMHPTSDQELTLQAGIAAQDDQDNG
uniref:Protein krueppel n=1 Tax=Anopheles farauti TaxID=69004 RepID=A0A182QE95_9DIPT